MVLDQLAEVCPSDSPYGTVASPEPTATAALAETRTGARSHTGPDGAWSHAYRWGAAAGDTLIATVIVAVVTAPLAMAPALLAAHAAATGAFFALTTGLQHGYDTRRAAAGPHEYGAVLRAGWIWGSLLVAMAYIGLLEVPAGQLLTAIAATVLTVLVARSLQRALVRHRRRHGYWLRRTLLVGEPEVLRSLTARFEAQPRYGFGVVGTCLSEPVDGWLAAPVLGDVEHAADVVAEHRIRVVVVTASCMGAADLRRFCWQVERYGVELLVAPNMEEVAPVRVALRPVSGSPLLTVAIGASRTQRAVKSLIDRLLGMLLLLASLPVLTASALLVRLTSAGPAYYRQTRIGRDGVPFTMIKLRTMYIDADRRRTDLLPHNDGNAVMFKMRQDPRVTPVGRVLRRFSLDELPQLWNVVRGEMSLVGPRPPLGEEIAGYDADARQRLRVKPGLTGLWQVSGRSDLDWAQTVRLDLNYVDNWSFLMDVTILCRTFRAVFGGRGAY
ncbi:sugar transferase [Ruania halotolerans]|uniref:sugar transferase n=1 Tax=Ruania halotolerans TaxID=2897773 RepID=UPI001E56DA7B|nr:sugar transferase [Ruania halotolerans]UFU05730.1 sugar transferase [Ruania halotolerans]